MVTQSESTNFSLVRNFIRRFLPNPQAIALAVILIVGFLLIFFLADLLMPLFAAIVVAYLLEGIVALAEKHNVPRLPAVLVVYSAFLTGLGYLLIVLMPMLYQQTFQLIQHVPDIIKSAQTEIMRLPDTYPQFISENKIRGLFNTVQEELLKYSQDLVSVSAAATLRN